MGIYKYNSKEDYIHHVRECLIGGCYWNSGADENMYSKFYDEYDDFILYISEMGLLTYGREGAKRSKTEIKLYRIKKNNLSNY